MRNSLTAPTRANFSRNDVLKYGSVLQFPVVNADTLLLAVVTDSTSVIDTNYPNPYSLQWLLSVEQQLSHNWAFDLSYVGNHCIHLVSVREINRPDRVAGIRPVTTLGTFDYYDSSESSNYNAMQTTLSRQFTRALSHPLIILAPLGRITHTRTVLILESTTHSKFWTDHRQYGTLDRLIWQPGSSIS